MTISLYSLELYMYYMDTERGLKNTTIFQNFLVGACPPTHIGDIASVQL